MQQRSTSWNQTGKTSQSHCIVSPPPGRPIQVFFFELFCMVYSTVTQFFLYRNPESLTHSPDSAKKIKSHKSKLSPVQCACNML